MVDRTVYANEAATPKLNLRQIFGRQGLDTALCRLSADKGLLTVEMFAMLGQDLSSAKETLRKQTCLRSAPMRRAKSWRSCLWLQSGKRLKRCRPSTPLGVPGWRKIRTRFRSSLRRIALVPRYEVRQCMLATHFL